MGSARGAFSLFFIFYTLSVRPSTSVQSGTGLFISEARFPRDSQVIRQRMLRGYDMREIVKYATFTAWEGAL